MTGPSANLRASALVAVILSLALGASTGDSTRTPYRDGACGAAGGRYDVGYPDPDSSDTDGDCRGEFPNYEGVARSTINLTNSSIRQCEEIRTFLLYDANMFEWTGWVSDEYWQDGGSWNTDIGLHWDWMDSEWLWIRQGGVAHFGAGEVEANLLADMCTSVK